MTKTLPPWLDSIYQECNSPEFMMDGPCLVVGKVYAHEDGKRVRITEGQWMGTHGISNHWHWEFVDESGKGTGETGHGYGWSAEPLEE